MICTVTLLIATSGFCAVHDDEFFKQTDKTNNNVKVYVNNVEIVRNQDNFEIATPETSNEDIVEQIAADQAQEEADQVQEKAVEQVETESIQEDVVEIQTPESSEDEPQEDNIKAVENAPSTLEYGSMVGNLVCNDVGLNVPVYWSGQQSTIDRKNSAICDPYRNLP